MAADKITYELTGINEVLDALDSLSEKKIMNIVKAIQRKVLKDIVITPLRAAIPYSQFAKKSIRIVPDKRDYTADYAGPTSDAYWLRWVERGTKQRTTKAGVNRGAITPRPIIIPFIESTPEKIVEFFNKDFGQAVSDELQKRISKIKK